MAHKCFNIYFLTFVTIACSADDGGNVGEPHPGEKKQLVPLEDFACQDVQMKPKKIETKEESFQVRSESQSVDSAVSEEQSEEGELSEQGTSSEEDDVSQDLVQEESEDEEKENQIDSSSPPSRPRRATRGKSINYIIDDDWSEEDDDAIVGLVPRKPDTVGITDEYDLSYSDDEFEQKSPSDALIPEPSMSFNAIESIVCSRKGKGGNREMRVKYAGISYRKTQWIDRDDLLAVGKQSLIRGYEKRLEQGKIDPYGDLEDGVHPDWCKVERIISERIKSGKEEYLVKWCDLNYSECTWESLDDLVSKEDAAALQKYERRKVVEKEKVQRKLAGENNMDIDIDVSKVPSFCNGRMLRDYQLESLKWMVQNWYTGKNCILGDEMGLGKTAQSISCIEFQRQIGKVSDPFLIIAPLTTLGHWKREIETWTDMNCLLYCGSAKDKQVILTHEVWCSDTSPKQRVVKPDVILSSYEHVMRDASFFQGIEWETMIIDEAHRMKGTKGSTRTSIAGIACQWILLLTGTPVQNNVKELFGILNLLDPEQFPDEDEFLDMYGRSTDKMTPQQVVKLQKVLKPLLLRRMKEDVETLPEKEECIIWVQLTREQRAYYKAIFENQIGALLGGASSKNIPALRNVAMELRKVCCHPYLCNGVEDDIAERNKKNPEGSNSELDLMVSSCGKMQLIHKLLPKLRKENKKVLIFSQFKIMLDVLEDYANLMEYPVERIDGTTAGRDRQASIDRFSRSEKDGFIFLLSTKAGGQGITLTAADTCILYDSDWNPQNDLQAMARCHRIGQTKDVTIYRLVSKDTYEENLFRASSRKYGLDEAILGGLGVKPGGDGNPEYDGKRISELLKHGAHCLKSDENADKETDAFLSENIDEILSSRTEKRQIGGRAGNTFSVANFGEDKDTTSQKDDEDFWKTILPEACEIFKNQKENPSFILPPRRKRSMNYNEMKLKRKASKNHSDDEEEEDGDDDYEFDLTAEEENGVGARKKKAKAAQKKISGKKWPVGDVMALFDGLLRFAMNLERFRSSPDFQAFLSKTYPEDQVLKVASVICDTCAEILSIAPDKLCSSYIVHKDASQEILEQADRQILRDKRNYQNSINDIAKRTSVKIKEGWESLGIPEQALQALCDPKLPTRIAKFAANISDHIDSLNALKSRLIDTDAPMPLILVKNTPDFWFPKSLLVRSDQGNDKQLLRQLYIRGWDMTMRLSPKQVNEIVAILKQNEHFQTIRETHLGTDTEPPTEESFITKDMWRESPACGYVKLAEILYFRIKKTFLELNRWKFIANSVSMPRKPRQECQAATLAEKEPEKAPLPVTKPQDTPQQLKTPHNVALDVFKENAGQFTGPTSNQSKPASSPEINKPPQHRQKSIFEAFNIKKNAASAPIGVSLAREPVAVDVDLTMDSP